MVIGPGRGPLPLLALGPTVAAATAAVLYTLAAGAVALAACLLLVVGSQAGATHRMTAVALMAVAGVTAAGPLAGVAHGGRELAEVRLVAEAAQQVLPRQCRPRSAWSGSRRVTRRPPPGPVRPRPQPL